MSTTPPRLTAVDQIIAGEGKVFTLYQGINLTILPDGQSATYSFVNSDRVTAHDSVTETVVTTKTTIPCEWPFVYVTATGGTIRVAVV